MYCFKGGMNVPFIQDRGTGFSVTTFPEKYLKVMSQAEGLCCHVYIAND